jgi:hypothetical protein
MMFKRIKNILFVICAVMVFTAQANRPDDKGQQHAPGARPAPAFRPAPASRPAPAARTAPVSRPQVQTRRQAPAQAVQRSLPRVNIKIPQPLDERSGQPRVYAVPAPSAPVENNRLFNRQHHNHWRPAYNYYNGQYNFYPYINVNSPVELSANTVTVLFNGQTYYYDRGSFYVQDPQGYLAVPPPIRIIVNALPAWAAQVNVDGQIYYSCKGAFYVQVAQGYQVVAPVQ